MITVEVTKEELSNIIFTLGLPMDIIKKALAQGVSFDSLDHDATELAIETTHLAGRLSSLIEEDK